MTRIYPETLGPQPMRPGVLRREPGMYPAEGPAQVGPIQQGPVRNNLYGTAPASGPPGMRGFAEDLRKLPGRAHAFQGLVGAEARTAPWLVAGIPRGLASAIHAQPGERMGAFAQGMEERARSIPGGEGALGTLEHWERRADESDLPPEWRTAAAIGAPDPVGDVLAALKAFQGARGVWAKGPGGKYKLMESKLGTGEGHYKEGYGHYLAEEPAVAQQYQRAGDPNPGGGTLVEGTLDLEYEDLLDLDAPLSEQSAKVKKALGKLGFGDTDSVAEVMPEPENMEGWLRGRREFSAVGFPGGEQLVAHEGMTFFETPDGRRGRVYPLTTNPEAHMIEWQTTQYQWEESGNLHLPWGREAATKALKENLTLQNWTGREVRQLLESNPKWWLDRETTPHYEGHYARKMHVSDILRDAGIPGSMFYDQKSRMHPAAIDLVRDHGSREAARKFVDDKLTAWALGEDPSTVLDYWKDQRRALNSSDTRNLVVFPGGEELLAVEKLNDKPVGALQLQQGPLLNR